MIPDIVVEDRDGRRVLVAEVKSFAVNDEDISRLVVQAKSVRPPTPLGVVVDPERIRVFDMTPEDPSSGALSFSTTEVLRHYDPDYAGANTPHSSDRVFAIYLTGLVGAWLADLANSWKPGEPPKKKELAEAGVLHQIEGGVTIERDLVRGDSLR